MFEWMPVWAGAVLGALQMHGRLGPRLTRMLVLLSAVVTGIVSGELMTDARFLLIDVGLAALGWAAGQLLMRAVQRRSAGRSSDSPA